MSYPGEPGDGFGGPAAGRPGGMTASYGGGACHPSHHPLGCQGRHEGRRRSCLDEVWPVLDSSTSSALRCRSDSSCSWRKATCSSRPRTRSWAATSSDCGGSRVLGRSCPASRTPVTPSARLPIRANLSRGNPPVQGGQGHHQFPVGFRFRQQSHDHSPLNKLELSRSGYTARFMSFLHSSNDPLGRTDRGRFNLISLNFPALADSLPTR